MPPGEHRQARHRRQGRGRDLRRSPASPTLRGLLGYIERLKGAAKLRPDSKMSVARDWPTPEARLDGALQLSRGLARVVAAGEARKSWSRLSSGFTNL